MERGRARRSVQSIRTPRPPTPSVVVSLSKVLVYTVLRTFIGNRSVLLELTKVKHLYTNQTMRFSVLYFLPLVAAVVEEKAQDDVQQTKQLRRRLKAQLFDVAAPPPADEVAKAVEDLNKAKEDEELWNRLLGDTNYSTDTQGQGWPWY